MNSYFCWFWDDEDYLWILTGKSFWVKQEGIWEQKHEVTFLCLYYISKNNWVSHPRCKRSDIPKEGTWKTQVLFWIVKCKVETNAFFAKLKKIMTSTQWQTENCWSLSSNRIYAMPKRMIAWFEYAETDKLLLRVPPLPLSYSWRTRKQRCHLHYALFAV